MLSGNSYVPITQADVNAAKKACHGRPANHVAMISVAQSELGPSSIPTLNVHPVDTVMPGITNLVPYHTASSTSVLEGADKSDDKVSVHPSNIINALIESVDSVVSIPPTEFS